MPAGAPRASPPVHLAGGMDPLRGRDADGRVVQEPCRGPTVVGCDPPPARRVDHRGSEVSACRPGGGSRLRPTTWLHHRMALTVAFPSHRNGRSPIAWLSPLDRQNGRMRGEHAAAEWRDFLLVKTAD